MLVRTPKLPSLRAHRVMAAHRRESKGGSLTEQLCDRLRGAIVRGELRPNQRLVEATLADWLGVSRTPVREALSRLVADHLVVSDRRGWTVREHTAQEIKDIFESRLALEGYASCLAAQRRTMEELGQIEAALSDEEGLLSLDRNRRVEANNRFHDLIVNAAHNALLVATIRQARLFYFNYQLAALYTEDELRASQSQHQGLAAAIRESDPVAAERWTREHIESAMRAALVKLAPPDAGTRPLVLDRR